jgi:hypothetical protein
MFPLWLKLTYSVFVAVTVAVYYVKYGPGNFLWFSDVALIVTVPALWLENGLLASMMALAVLLPEVLWNLEFFLRACTGIRLTGLTDYMFDRSKPLYLRALSLFHVALPPLLLWMVARLGYDAHALAAQTLLTWVLLPATYGLTKPADNINWVYGFGATARTRLPPHAHVALLMVAVPLIVYWPTHLLLQHFFG